MDSRRFYDDTSAKILRTTQLISAREYLQLILSRRQLERVTGADHAATDRITGEEFAARNTEIRKIA